jgi:hypothetical protein
LANLQEFKNKVNFEGGTPDDPIAAGRFAVLLEPLDVNAIGRGIVAGVTPVKVIVNPDHLYDFTEMEAGNTLLLCNTPVGSARVLWVEASVSTERCAVVRLGDAEDVLRFQLLKSLSRCGAALAKPVVFQNGKRWLAEVAKRAIAATEDTVSSAFV